MDVVKGLFPGPAGLGEATLAATDAADGARGGGAGAEAAGAGVAGRPGEGAAGAGVRCGGVGLTRTGVRLRRASPLPRLPVRRRPDPVGRAASNAGR